MLISLLFENPLAFFLVALSLVISITIHEFAHAFAAYKLGDFTAKIAGRMSLDPRAHLDLMGTLLLLSVGIGWGRPVPFNPNLLKNPKRDSALIALAGPASNFLLAILVSIFFRLMNFGVLENAFFLVVFYNLMLGFFNLIPINPLDGFKIVSGILPQGLFEQWVQVAPFGSYILLFLVLTRTIGKLLGPMVNFVMHFLGF